MLHKDDRITKNGEIRACKACRALTIVLVHRIIIEYHNERNNTDELNRTISDMIDSFERQMANPQRMLPPPKREVPSIFNGINDALKRIKKEDKK